MKAHTTNSQSGIGSLIGFARLMGESLSRLSSASYSSAEENESDGKGENQPKMRIRTWLEKNGSRGRVRRKKGKTYLRPGDEPYELLSSP
jgi:hypothetical protein